MPDVLIDLDERGIATLTLNREKRKNGITANLVEEMITALDQLSANSQCRVVVVTGAGSAFCSGMDLGEPIVPDEVTFMNRVGRLCQSVHEFPMPVIAKVRGAAMGFGANLALCADLILADDTAVFGEIFTERGLSIDGGGSWTLPRSVGLHRAKEIMLMAARLSGPEAADIGLINRCVGADALDGIVADWAGRLSDGPRRALSVVKKQINAGYGRSFGDVVDAEAAAQALAFRSREAREGAKAFFEKRQPDFRSC